MCVTHYDFVSGDDEDYVEKSMCGTNVGENYEYSNNWKYVTCKKCLKRESLIKQEIIDIQEQRNKYDEGFVDFMFEQRYNCECGFKGCLDELKFESEPVTYDGIWKCPECSVILDR